MVFRRHRRLTPKGSPKGLQDRQVDLLNMLNDGENSDNEDRSNTILIREWQLKQIMKERICIMCRSKRSVIVEESIGMSKYIDSVCGNRNCIEFKKETEKKDGFFARVWQLISDGFTRTGNLLKRLQGAIRPTVIIKNLGMGLGVDKVKSTVQIERGCCGWDEHTIRTVLSVFVTGQTTNDTKIGYCILGMGSAKKFDKIYGKVSPMICRAISSVSKKFMRRAFLDEVYATMDDVYKDMSKQLLDVEKKKWKYNEPGRLPVSIAVSYDMGWQKRSSGNRYDSMSGHGVLVGCRTKKVIDVIVFSKICQKCQEQAKRGQPMNKDDHVCSENMGNIKSSKGMEAEGAYRLLTGLHEKHLIKVEGGEPICKLQFECLVTDDDSTMWAQLVHKKNERDNVGRLPATMTSIKFYCDPGHRIKCWSKPFFKMVRTTPKAKTNLTASRVERLKRYIGYFLKQNRAVKSLEWFVKNASAPLEHLFNNHQYCDKSWCVWKESCENGDHSNCHSSWCGKCKSDDKRSDEGGVQQDCNSVVVPGQIVNSVNDNDPNLKNGKGNTNERKETKNGKDRLEGQKKRRKIKAKSYFRKINHVHVVNRG